MYTFFMKYYYFETISTIIESIGTLIHYEFMMYLTDHVIYALSFNPEIQSDFYHTRNNLYENI